MLSISRIPSYISHNKLLIREKRGVFSNYSCVDPQTYFIDYSFLKAKCLAKEKVEYLYMLSNRVMTSNKSYIPKNYINQKYWKNLFVKIEDDKLYFIPEQLRRSRNNVKIMG